MVAYYNENDPKAADWLESLIADRAISPGVVDRRSILDVRPSDFVGFHQHHFFAGIGVWSYSLRQAGWPDDRAIWTGSCPCQPFSASGSRRGFADERHLWPAFHHLIREHNPSVVVGEQVASTDGLAWLDLVHADMEGSGYALGALNTPAAGVGAPEIRQRLFWLGNSALGRVRPLVRIAGAGAPAKIEPRGPGFSGWLANGDGGRHAGTGDEGSAARSGAGRHDIAGRCDDRGLADTGGERWWGAAAGCEARASARTADGGEAGDRGPVNGFWRDADWLRCRDEHGSWRPVRPGSFPLVNGMPRSMAALSPELQRLATVAGLDRKSFARAKAFRRQSLKGYGNAIVAPQAVAFIKAVMQIVIPIAGWLIVGLLVAAMALKQGIG